MRTFVDFFCGAGGSSLGAEQAGLRPVGAVNHWLVAARTYERNHGISPVCHSISMVDPDEIPHADVLLFSPECTSHSQARGAKPRDEISRSTALEVVRFVASMRPSLFVVENVPGFRSYPLFGQWCADLQEAGYHLNHDASGRVGQILNSADFGVPQSRRRLFVVGSPTCEISIQAPRTRRRAVGECLDWSLPMARIDARPRAAATLRRIARGREQFGERPFLISYFGTSTGGHPLDRPCGTLTTRDRYALIRGGEMRMLQPAELLRVMGFPDSYQLAGTRAQMVMQIGNAVAPPVMRQILEEAS